MYSGLAQARPELCIHYDDYIMVMSFPLHHPDPRCVRSCPERGRRRLGVERPSSCPPHPQTELSAQAPACPCGYSWKESLSPIMRAGKFTEWLK